MMKTTAALLCLLCAGTTSGLEVAFSGAGQATRYTVQHKGVTLFNGSPVAVFSDGKWGSQADGSLKFVKTDVSTGTDAVLGGYKATAMSWVKGSTPFITTVKNFNDGLTVTFAQEWPQGARGTSLVKANVSGTNSHLGVIANFPALENSTLPNTLSWAGSFVGAQVNAGYRVTGSTGGPTVFFDGTDATFKNVVIISPLDHFKAASAGPGTAADGVSPAFAPGTTGTITSIPAGFVHTFVMRAGDAGGVTATVGEWGDMLQAYYKSWKLVDVTLTNIGYQTDNGAGYVFCRPKPPYANCNELLIDELKQLKALGVPMGYLSYQGAGVSSMTTGLAATGAVQGGEEVVLDGWSRAKAEAALTAVVSQPAAPPGPKPEPSAPWCVNEWGPDLNMTQRSHGQFPMDLGAFQKELGVPLQLYAPYFCPESKYFKKNNPASKWTSVSSDITLPGCSYYGFQDVTPEESRAYYDDFFARGKADGMASFEPDFMNQNYNCVPDFIESATAATVWQHGMTDAALAQNLTVQWCYAAPTDVLASLEMPALTNFRVSNDFCYGSSWNVGVSSLIVWAVGSAPSKDTLWTSDNGKFSVPGCQWSPDHETPAAELHVVIALMTTGPVGISDLIGMTNATLAKRTITQDGTLLKPSKPITTVDSFFSSNAGPDNGLDAGAQRSPPPGHVYTTYTGDTLSDPTAWYFVSFQMTADWGIPAADFYPPLPTTAGSSVVYRSFDSGAGCVNGAAASTCITAVSSFGEAVLMAPTSNHANVTGGTDYAPTVSTVWPACPSSGAVLLGELQKYVSVSPQRFKGVTCTSSGVAATVVGTAGESVVVTAIKADKTVVVMDVVIPASGSKSILV